MKHFKNYINGNWVEGDLELLSVNNPATGEVLSTVPKVSSEKVKSAVGHFGIEPFLETKYISIGL